MRKEIVLGFDIQAQPDEVTCGPTCLQALYNHYGDTIPLKQVIQEVKQLKTGGTLAVMLGNHALKRGYKAHIYTYNLNVFDPTWFEQSSRKMIRSLKQQMDFKFKRRKLQVASRAYIKFLEAGGTLHNTELDANLIMKYLKRGIPILTGLSATYLYGTPREIPQFDIYDSIKGEPAGHFVVISGYDEDKSCVYLSDPMEPNPLGKGQVYSVSFARLINSIMLGIVTYDANLLVIEPKKGSGKLNELKPES
ncbi:MAG: C39 family peptidase [Cyclobacteriaceae bacterium]|nr:C39 family peptidase [Cyclobacteriaceae bacterium]